MSYDISLIDKHTGEIARFNAKQHFTGGTYQPEGSEEANINITYNYSQHFRRVLGEEGIRVIYGLTGDESSDILIEAIDQLKENEDSNYWVATEGNARKALMQLWHMAILLPDAIWDGD